MKEDLQNLAGESNGIIFAGKVPPSHVSKYYRFADLFVSASTSETQGLTYFEALACGLPTLCRMDPCLDNVVINGFNGYKFEDYDAYKKYIEEMLCSSTKRDLLSQNALEHSKLFSTSSFANSIENIYLKVINSTSENKVC